MVTHDVPLGLVTEHSKDWAGYGLQSSAQMLVTVSSMSHVIRLTDIDVSRRVLIESSLRVRLRDHVDRTNATGMLHSFV